MNRRIAAIVAAPVFALTLVGCSEQFTFEAHPSGSGDTDNGYIGDPRQIECFVIEADSTAGDESDRQLGEFCKKAGPVSPEAQQDIDEETEDDV